MTTINRIMRVFAATVVCLALCPFVALLLAVAFVTNNICEAARGNEATVEDDGIALVGNIVACKLFPWSKP